MYNTKVINFEHVFFGRAWLCGFQMSADGGNSGRYWSHGVRSLALVPNLPKHRQHCCVVLRDRRPGFLVMSGYVMLALACLWLCGLSRRVVQELLDVLCANPRYDQCAQLQECSHATSFSVVLSVGHVNMEIAESIGMSITMKLSGSHRGEIASC